MVKYRILAKSQSTHDWLTHKQPHNFLLRLVYFVCLGYGLLIMMIPVGMAFDAGFSWLAAAIASVYAVVAISLLALTFLPTKWLNKPTQFMKYWTWGLLSLIAVLSGMIFVIELLKP